MLGATGFPVRKRYVVDGQSYLLPQRAEPWRAAQGRRAGVLPVQERRARGPRHADAGGCRARLPGGLEAAARSSSARIASATLPRTRRSNLKIGNAFDVVAERKQTDFEKIATNVYEFEYEIVLRNHKSDARDRRSERADRRDVADPAFDTSSNEDGRLGDAVQRSGRGGWERHADLSCPRDLLTRARKEPDDEQQVQRHQDYSHVRHDGRCHEVLR